MPAFGYIANVTPLKREDLLLELLTLPTAPFREKQIFNKISLTLNQESVPHFFDPIGNLVIGVESKRAYLEKVRKHHRGGSQEPLRVFIAHTDHPGFHGERWISDQELQIKWHGGSPTQYLEGAKVWWSDTTASPAVQMGQGTLKKPQLDPAGRHLDSAIIKLADSTVKNTKATNIFGGFAFRAPVWREQELIYTKAADDLVGCFSVLSIALDLWGKQRRNQKAPPFIGLLTRAEEVGFIGAIGHFQLGWLEGKSQSPRPIICISLETSRTLPGAEIGKGPVVRLGDRFTVFDPSGLRILSELASKALPGRHQRRIMDGGTCEASAATVYGFPSIGISIPLGNYHNQSFEGGPDASPTNGPAPEFVHSQDVAGMIELCHGLVKADLAWKDPWKSKYEEFKKNFRKYKRLFDNSQVDKPRGRSKSARK